MAPHFIAHVGLNTQQTPGDKLKIAPSSGGEGAGRAGSCPKGARVLCLAEGRASEHAEKSRQKKNPQHQLQGAKSSPCWSVLPAPQKSLRDPLLWALKHSSSNCCKSCLRANQDNGLDFCGQNGNQNSGPLVAPACPVNPGRTLRSDWGLQSRQ